MEDKVNDRLKQFKEYNPMYSLETEIDRFEGDRVVIRAILSTETSRYTGIASQKESLSFIERCETFAIGRALAAAGYGNMEYASENELEFYRNKKNEQSQSQRAYSQPAPPEPTLPPPADPMDDYHDYDRMQSPHTSNKRKTNTGKPLTDSQIKVFRSMIDEGQFSDVEIDGYAANRYEVNRYMELSAYNASDLMKYLNSMKRPRRGRR
jgi:hypothetical protein